MMPYNAKNPKAAALAQAGLMAPAPAEKEPETAKEPEKK